MSGEGIVQCMIAFPLGMLGPFGGFFLGILCGLKQRKEVIKLYDIDDSQSACGQESVCLGNFLLIRLFIYFSYNAILFNIRL